MFSQIKIIQRIGRLLGTGSLFLLIMITACSHTNRSMPGMLQNDFAGFSSTEKAYRRLKAQWTIHLGAQNRGSYPMLVGARGNHTGHGAFPLNVSATLMTDQVIDTGIDFYSEQLEMDSRQKDALKMEYQRYHQLDHYFLVEISMRTTWSDSYLDLKRWLIFIEDDAGNMSEPAKIVEKPMRSASAAGRGFGMPGDFHSRRIYLYFKRLDIYGKRTISDSTKSVKLVIQLEAENPERAEGTWFFTD
ncbi:hypothetical protein JXJ21_07420 [candidate division KSB1 bacterium]|nr:hypothetical protein [candidate division KSB1 bacterium]